MYMEDCVYLMHRERFVNFYDEKVDWLFIWWNNIDRVVALTDKDLILFWREKFSIFAIIDSCTAELKRCVKKGDKLWKYVNV